MIPPAPPRLVTEMTARDIDITRAFNQAPNMKTRLYQLYDLTAQMVTGPIVSEKKDGPAIRAFHAVLADNRTLPGRYPDQFQLRLLGEQDEETGWIDPATGPKIVATGDAWLKYANHQGKDPEMATWGQTSDEQ